VFHNLHAVDVHMDESLPHPLPLLLLAKLSEVTWISEYLLRCKPQCAVLLWLRLKTHPRWLSHHCESHISGVSQPWYDVDVHKDESSPHYHCPCGPTSYLKLLGIWIFPGGKPQCVDLIEAKTHPSWLSHNCETHIKYVYSPFICCGCAYGESCYCYHIGSLT